MPITRADRRPIGEVDLLVVGSGPVGATVAATVSRLRPGARILVVEAGAAVTDPPGASLQDLPVAERRRLDQGNVDALSIALEWQATATQVLQSVGLRTCVGGMASIWSAAVPRPLRWEVPDLVPWPEMMRRLGHAERLLGVAGSPAVPEPAAVLDLRARLACFAAGEGRHLRPRWLPAAEVRRGCPPVPTGTATILRTAGRRAILRDRSLCAFRTPQLLWVSGIRPAALGRHLHEHPMVNARGLLPVPTP